jgi:RNA polymerase sigma-70 factor, ECF subfamily
MSILLGDEFARVLAAAQSGEEWAVARLYRAVNPSLIRYLAAREPQEGEDIASQVWLEVARSLERFSGAEDAFRALVFTIGRRRLANARRSRARRRAEVVEIRALDVVAARDDPAGDAEDRVTAAQAIARINELLRPEQADVVLLRVVAGLSVEQVATIVGKSPAAVRVMQHRALQSLAKRLDGKL